MFEVGFTEIVLILGIALLVLGPARLPKLAADIGRWAGKARGMARQLRTQLEQEASTFDPLRDAPRPVQTIHTPPAPAPAASTATQSTPDDSAPAAATEPTPDAAPAAPADTLDATNESKPA
jgi:Tat protein translocase TatB subunit